MGHVPSGFVGDFKLALELFRGDAFLGRTDHVDGEEPLGQRQVRIVEDGPDSGGELVAAFKAGVEIPHLPGLSLGLELRDALLAALGTFHTLGPADALEMGDALFLGVEPLEDFNDGGLGLCHG